MEGSQNRFQEQRKGRNWCVTMGGNLVIKGSVLPPSS